MVVRLFVDASYGVHKDGKSHTGSCVVIGEVGAVHCISSKQDIVVKSSTEGELVVASNSANQATLKAIPHSARIQDGASDHVPR
jgi:hypothetical protein